MFAVMLWFVDLTNRHILSYLSHLHLVLVLRVHGTAIVGIEHMEFLDLKRTSNIKLTLTVALRGLIPTLLSSCCL
jgi:hypothetical protein